jgi:aromatic ring-opening dioxygenase catalytic subunit (LigB family)
MRQLDDWRSASNGLSRRADLVLGPSRRHDPGMSNEEGKGVTRRAAIATGIAGATAAALAGMSVPDAVASGAEDRTRLKGRMPVVYVPHGGGPWPWVDLGFDKAELDGLATYLRSVRAVAKSPPKAVVVVSAHWEEAVPTVMTSARPPMLYDYYGFPPASYEITWPAPGDPKLAARVRALASAAGFGTAENATRGYDHGTFVPLKLTFPDAEVPTVQLSMLSSLDPAEHLRLGRALAPLRDEGVLIVASGMSFHNLRAFRDPRARGISETFDQWLREAVTVEPAERDRRLTAWATAPAARAAHPREEHLLPLMVAAGAAGEDRGTVAFNATVMGVRLSGVHFG